MQPHCEKPTDTGRLCVRRANHHGDCTASPTILELLAFENRHLKGAAKAVAIEADLGISPARYFQLLNRAIDTTEALEADPILTHQLSRRRDVKLTQRTR